MLVELVGRLSAELDFDAVEVAAGDEVERAADRTVAVQAGADALGDLDTLDQRDRQLIGVDVVGSAIAVEGRVHEPASVEQDQRRLHAQFERLRAGRAALAVTERGGGVGQRHAAELAARLQVVPALNLGRERTVDHQNVVCGHQPQPSDMRTGHDGCRGILPCGRRRLDVAAVDLGRAARADRGGSAGVDAGLGVGLHRRRWCGGRRRRFGVRRRVTRRIGVGRRRALFGCALFGRRPAFDRLVAEWIVLRAGRDAACKSAEKQRDSDLDPLPHLPTLVTHLVSPHTTPGSIAESAVGGQGFPRAKLWSHELRQCDAFAASLTRSASAILSTSFKLT